MAILASSESVGTVTSSAHGDSDLNHYAKTVSDSFSKPNSSDAAESLINGAENDRNQIGSGGARVESANEFSNGKDGGDKVGNGENREMDNLRKFAYRPKSSQF